MALSDLGADRTEIVPIPQILAANQLGEKPTLASALYLPHPEEFRSGSFQLPWGDGGEPRIVGQFARDHGALAPDRLVTSAKSWLSNPHIDPKAAHASVALRERGREALAVRLLPPLSAAPQGRLPPRR